MKHKRIPRDWAALVADAARLNASMRRVPRALEQLVKQTRLLFELCRCYADGTYREVPRGSIVTAASALMYFMLGTDLVPDALPGVGFVDDATVIALAVRGIQHDLSRFCRFMGYAEADYFD